MKPRRFIVAPVALATFAVFAGPAAAIKPPGSTPGPKTPYDEPATGIGQTDEPAEPGQGEFNRVRDHGRGGNSYANDPCLDPPPPNRRRTVQSETEIAVLNRPGDSVGKKIVVGYNDSFGFYDREEGLSGYAYSTDGGNTFIDGGGLPPRIPGGHNQPPFAEGVDGYFGDPVVVVHNPTARFFFSSIYKNPSGYFTLSVNRGTFEKAPPQDIESESNTRCLNDSTQQGVADTPERQTERIIWEPPVEAVRPPNLGAGNTDFLDKEWLYVDQNTGTLYLTYTRFTVEGETPIELVRCPGCAFKATFTEADWTPPTVIVPNELTEFNQATQPFTTPTGRVIVTWFARSFDGPGFAETEQRIEYAYSDNDGQTFTPEQIITQVNPQGEPPGYNRRRPTILNAPYIYVDRGFDDGVFTAAERARRGFGNVYVTYFDGKTPLGRVTKAADIYLSTSQSNGTAFETRTKVNDDNTNTVHVFPTVQATRTGDVYVGWIDRRVDQAKNELNDTWAAVSKDFGVTFGHNRCQTQVSTSWFTRADARPNFGDYNSSELLAFTSFVQTFADGRFLPPGREFATPDTIFDISNGLGTATSPPDLTCESVN